MTWLDFNPFWKMRALMTRPEDPGALETTLGIARFEIKMESQQYLRSLCIFLSPMKTAATEMILTCEEASLYFCFTFNNLPFCLPSCLKQ